MQKNFEDMAVREYNELLGSDAPAPGGGSALCQVGAIACSLLEMAITITANKAADETRDYLLAQQETVARAKRAFYKLSNDDAAAFLNITKAFKLPKATDEEQKARAATLQKAYHRAALVPLDVINLCKLLVTTAMRIAPMLGKYVASDCTIAIDLLKSTAKSSLMNVYANTSRITDADLAQSLNRQGEIAVENI